MSSINTNVGSLIASNALTAQNGALSTSLERLSTGLQINRGSDNPAGLIASQELASNAAATTAAISNAQTAGEIVNTADGALSQVNSLLVQLQGLVTTSASSTGTSATAQAANQQQIDAILQTIDQISSTTNFAGTKLINGNLDFQVTGQSSNVSSFEVDSANFSTAAGSKLAVNAVITQSAQHGTVFLSTGGTSLNLKGSTSQFTFDLAGSEGTKTFSFASGTTLATIASAVNNFTSVTGVSAVASGNVIKVQSNTFGSNSFASVRIDNTAGQTGSVALASTTNENKAKASTAASFSSLSGSSAIRGTGQDVGAVINGLAAQGSGLTATVDSDGLAATLNLTAAAAQKDGTFSAFTITGGGATFNLGANVNLNSQVRLGIGSVATDALGTNSGLGSLADLGSGKSLNVINGDLTNAQTVVNSAIDQVSDLRGRLGAFSNYVIGSTTSSLNVDLENTESAESNLTDTNYATETANLTRAQVLVSAATSALAIANSQPQNILKLLQ